MLFRLVGLTTDTWYVHILCMAEIQVIQRTCCLQGSDKRCNREGAKNNLDIVIVHKISCNLFYIRLSKLNLSHTLIILTFCLVFTGSWIKVTKIYKKQGATVRTLTDRYCYYITRFRKFILCDQLLISC